MLATVLVAYFIAVLCYGPKLSWHRTVYRALLIFLTFCLTIGLFGESYRQRRNELKVLNILCDAVALNQNANRVYYSEGEKQAFLDSLYDMYDEVERISSIDSLYAVFIGRNDELIERVEIAKKILNNQIKRYAYLNVIIDNVVLTGESVDGNSFVKIIGPDTYNLPVLNVGVRFYNIPNESQFEKISVRLVNEKNSILFQQLYAYKSPISTFMIPNNPDAEIIEVAVWDESSQRWYVVNKPIY